MQSVFSRYQDEVRVQNPCTFLPRHSTDITYHISFQSPLQAPELRNVTLLAFLPFINHLCFTKERISPGRVYVHFWECTNVCMCVRSCRGGKMKAARVVWLQSFKILSCLLYLPRWQLLCAAFLGMSLAPYSAASILPAPSYEPPRAPFP